ncbi:MAG: DNA polymerase III subunit alpha [Flavobacteriales bacterium]|nr:DNA polymerase III subunit alpha [Flavobacteriales bacterium]
MFLIFDTETTGLPRNYKAPLTDFDNWPRCVQLAWQLHDVTGKLISNSSFIISPDGFSIPYLSEKVHGISTERAQRDGTDLNVVISKFLEDVSRCTYLAGHNIEFDLSVMGCELLRVGMENILAKKKTLDTKELGTNYCALPGGKGGKYKWPTLTELHEKLYGQPFEEAHDAAYDVSATAKCFFELIKRSVIQVSEANEIDVFYEAPDLSIQKSTPVIFQEQVEDSLPHQSIISDTEPGDNLAPLVTGTEISNLPTGPSEEFIHLHVHSQYSVLQSTSEINSIIKKAKEWNLPAIAITDHGNMMAAFKFVSAALENEIKPIVGCELNVCRNRIDRTTQDNGYQMVFLAKNKNGYHNLAKLSSIAHTEGFYYVPRIDRETVLKFKEDLLVLSGGLWGEVSSKILNEGEEKAEESFLWWKENFGADFYVELNRHDLEEEDVVNKVLLRFCEKHQAKYFASNNSYYTTQEEAEAQDALVCVKEGEYISKPKKYIGKRGREFRFGLPNDNFYLKSPEEMCALFSDLPEAISTTVDIAAKCESFELTREVLLPKFDIPEKFIDAEDSVDAGKRGENSYLQHLTYEGAIKRYGEITDELRERLDFELATIANTNYPGYFLIVQDFCAKARQMDVSVGPGRGSAAGSCVAYCLGITNCEPIRYKLLFERFLNPERVSMPDIDIDFDDLGRDKVIDYVRKKYGDTQVAQIITYGTMGGKSAIRDAGRVFELPLPDTDRLAKLMGDGLLRDYLNWDEKKLRDELNGDTLRNVSLLREIAKQDSKEAKVLQMAALLEGSVRNTGIHACGVIITPDDVTNFVPVVSAKDSHGTAVQFDVDVVEHAGLLKMDFLGLKTLTILKDAIKVIQQRHGILLDMDEIPLDDEETYKLFQRGHTVGIFQYESEGMQKYLRELKPNVLDDLIAMNALYRPGPLDYIPQFIRRKNGVDPISYDLPEMEEFLKETYGIAVYQEQVMLLSQKLAGFTKGEADILRKAMGKKQRDTLDKMKNKFIEGAKAIGHPEDKLEKIWTDWEAFASYAFNKSHSTCYALIGYHTAYLKAHYPAEYMAAVLSNNMSDIKSVSFFMQECRKQNIPVLGPDVNESKALFSVNEKGEIRFGLAAIKGMGESAVESIVAEQKNGKFKNVFDYLKRVDTKAAGKKVVEGCALAGAFDVFKIPRAAYFAPDGRNETFAETLVRYGTSSRDSKNSNQVSLFGDAGETVFAEPKPPAVEPWDTLTQLSKEKEVVGMYISGHPLDDFALELKSFCTKGNLSLLQDLEVNKNRDLKVAGMVTDFNHKISRASNKPFGTFKLEDYDSSFEFILFGEDYLKFKHFLQAGEKLWLLGKVQQRRFGADTQGWEFRITRVELLFEVREKFGRYLNIRFSLEQLNNALVEQLASSFKNGTGKTQVRVQVKIDEGELKMPSTAFNRISITHDVLAQLDKIPEVEFDVTET